MSSFRAVAIPTEVADSVRSTMKSPKYGFPAHREVAAGRAPCRHCLELVRLNKEELILFTMDAFHGLPNGETVPPCPGPVYYEGARLPASYANFYIANGVVLVPLFDDPCDVKALGILQELFPDRKVVGLPCTAVVAGLGAIHCVTQQEPAVPSGP